ncbi:hypothetical protein Golax_024848 [Gossypium laxum]|uniref:Uncharacterized protein n=1 Tax=Gossypium laxum TaxID=34288 RepID=A0A7J8ZDC6_9ROSI|nr:hypothetical protein [Gossypium laxum]
MAGFLHDMFSKLSFVEEEGIVLENVIPEVDLWVVGKLSGPKTIKKEGDIDAIDWNKSCGGWTEYFVLRVHIDIT